MTVIEEKSLVKHLLDADKWSFSIRPEFLHGMAQILLQVRTHDPTTTLGVNWAYKFVKHHPELCTRYNRRISYQRARQEDPNIIKQWFKLYAKLSESMAYIKMISRTLMRLAL
jgi:hypothetical protein